MPRRGRNQPFGGGINVDDCGQPAGVVDMAFIAWRNLRLINRIATRMALNWGITAVCVCLSWYC